MKQREKERKRERERKREKERERERERKIPGREREQGSWTLDKGDIWQEQTFGQNGHLVYLIKKVYIE